MMMTTSSTMAKTALSIASAAVLLVALTWSLLRMHAATTELASRVGALQAALQAAQDSRGAGEPAPASERTAASLARLTESVDHLHARLAALEARQQGEGMTPDGGYDARDTDRAGDAGRAEPPTAALDTRHAREQGRSDWGAQTTGRLHWHYADAAFFNRHGGELAVDCRRTICRLGWQTPDARGLTPDEASRIAVMAKYELLAIVAAGAPDSGPIHSGATMNGSRPRIEVYFEHREGQQ
ncbi:MAG: hypothetical protein K9M02_03200 [Thiohalocapsa sp.]|nr:hypothetical protein [Thiohalocapsa sp.]